MAEITASLVKDLREKTGAGMMDCKKALTESAGDIEAAVDWLRAKGLSKAAKKADRAAAEGVVAVAADALSAAVIELNSETDFVARNETFQAAARAFAQVTLGKKGDLDAVLAASAPGGEGSVQDAVTGLIASIGENITLRRAGYLAVSSGLVANYVHNEVVPGMGKIGVLLALESTAPAAALEAIGRKVAQHVAALAPISVSEADIPAERIEREKAILLEQVRQDPKAQGKPEPVIAKMLEGRLRKFFEESVLLKQTFVHNPDQTVEAAVAEAAKAAGAAIAVTGMVRFAVGEGVEKKADDFAAEVAAMTKGG
jgi:elongation factor Ts